MRSFANRIHPDQLVADPYWKEVAVYARWLGPAANLPSSAAQGYDLGPNNCSMGFSGTNGPAVSATQSKFGGFSLQKNGNGTVGTGNVNINPPNIDNFNIGTRDFTIESWIYRISKASPANFGFLCMDVVAGNSRGTILFQGSDPDTGWKFGLYDGTTWNQHSGVVPAATWTHIAVSRTNGNLYSHINGTATNHGTYTFNLGRVGTSGYTRIGTSPGGENLWNFFCDELRITIGRGRYSGNFTPPEKAFPTPTLA
jgi:hypothetical protein